MERLLQNLPGREESRNIAVDVGWFNGCRRDEAMDGMDLMDAMEFRRRT
jgi:hypothetical protein